jgi:TolB-like protein/DNA-binding winged helix-turn-helix (wHTH) protein
MDERLPLFGPFALDVARGCLLRAGDPVHLRPQSYRVLEYLVRHRGRLVGKDTLIEHVWQGRAVGDDSLVQCLRDVRLALDDAGARVVRTIRGRGYIFEPPAQPVPLAAEPSTPSRVPVEADEHAERGAAAIDAPRHTSTSPTPPPSRWALPRSTAAIATLLAVAAAAMAYVLLARPSARSAAFDSVAVLPFVNESTDADSEYLADGGTESLINTLAQVQGLSVKPRSAVFRFRGTDLPPQRLAEELSVDAIVYGRVVREGPQLTVSMSLVDGRTGNQLWGERYTQELTALAAMQHEIAVDVARKLQRRLIGADAETLASGYTPAADAYLLYLRGRYHNQRSNEGDMRTAIDFYGRAVDADPQYALAHAGLAEAYRALSIVGEAPSSEAFPRARSAALRALALDDRLAEAHRARLDHLFVRLELDCRRAGTPARHRAQSGEQRRAPGVRASALEPGAPRRGGPRGIEGPRARAALAHRQCARGPVPLLRGQARGCRAALSEDAGDRA